MFEFQKFIFLLITLIRRVSRDLLDYISARFRVNCIAKKLILEIVKGVWVLELQNGVTKSSYAK